MAAGGIRFQRPRSSIRRERFLERVTDWHEEGMHVKRILAEYDRDYRRKICSTCTAEQRQRRGCRELDMYTPEGVRLRHCGHMDRARVKKHERLIKGHMQLHPALAAF